jgi:nitroimidazol reductase NimA-like FMN-containing flavoprotein (pyridoxamine 5'-phosphate oxidase superfamily)
MESLRYVETIGMTREEALTYLEDAPSGVLALASDGRAYALPVSHTVHEGTLYLRLTEEGASERLELESLAGTEEATFVCYGEDGTDS